MRYSFNEDGPVSPDDYGQNFLAMLGSPDRFVCVLSVFHSKHANLLSLYFHENAIVSCPDPVSVF